MLRTARQNYAILSYVNQCYYCGSKGCTEGGGSGGEGGKGRYLELLPAAGITQ